MPSSTTISLEPQPPGAAGGRVDRFGQPNKMVKVLLLYGADNPVDLVVLKVLIRKAQTIRRRLGIPCRCRWSRSRSCRPWWTACSSKGASRVSSFN